MAKKTVVMNVKSLGKDYVYIGRGSKWGNPYRLVKGADRGATLTLYKRHLWRSKLMDDLHELRGKKLVCFCSPEPCHGDVLVAALAWQDGVRREQAAAKKTDAEASPEAPAF